MADRLIVNYTRRGFVVQWYLEEDDDLGAILGEGSEEQDIARMERALRDNTATAEELEHYAATVAISKTVDRSIDRSTWTTEGFHWEHERDAKQALRVAKAAIKEAQGNKPWPEWARQAAAAGWKPPKNWKP